MRSPCAVGVLVAAGIASACGSEMADRMPSAALGPISVYDAYAPASPTSDVASVYFTVVNRGAQPDTLLGVSAPSGMAHLHEVITDNDLTRMSPVSALPVPPNGALRLAPGGYHIMLSGMGRRLQVGDTMHVQLEFARAGSLLLPVAVLTYTEVVRRLEASQNAHR
jgi:copper(I)-binding protein